jgi:hypothetical protein
VAHTCSPSMQEVEAELKFKASLRHILRSRFKNKTKQRKTLHLQPFSALVTLDIGSCFLPRLASNLDLSLLCS